MQQQFPSTSFFFITVLQGSSGNLVCGNTHSNGNIYFNRLAILFEYSESQKYFAVEIITPYGKNFT